MSKGLDHLLGNGIKITVGGKELRIRPLTVDEQGEIESYVRAKAMRAFEMSIRGGTTMTKREIRNMRMSLALEPLSSDDLIPRVEEFKTDCVHCGSIDTHELNGDQQYKCDQCGKTFYARMSMTNADVAMRQLWLSVRDKSDPELAEFSAFEKFIRRVPPEDWAKLNAVVSGVNGADPEDEDDADPTRSSSSGPSG